MDRLRKDVCPPMGGIISFVILLMAEAVGVAGQNQPPTSNECSCSGSVVSAVILTLVITAALGFLVFYFYFKKRKGKSRTSKYF